MQKIKYIRDYKNKKVGDIESVSNNIAHGLVENSIVILYRDRMFKSPVDKMMRTEREELSEEVDETRADRRARLRKERNEYKVK